MDISWFQFIYSMLMVKVDDHVYETTSQMPFGVVMCVAYIGATPPAVVLSPLQGLVASVILKWALQYGIL